MFIRKRKNASGSVTVAAVEKRGGRYKEVKIFGTADTEEEVTRLCDDARHWMLRDNGQTAMDFDGGRVREREETLRVVDNMDAVLLNGTQLLLGRVYDGIGFNRIPDEILRHLVTARVSQPRSKMATVEYLKSYYDKGFLVQAAGGSPSRPLLLSYHVRHPHSVRPWNTSSFSWHTILSHSCVTSSKCPKRFTPRIVARIAVFRYK